MKIILLINSLFTGGAEFSTMTFYGWLKQSTDYEIKIVCLKRAEPAYNFRDFGFNNVKYLKNGSFKTRLKDFNELVESFKPDLVHSVLFDANLLGRVSRLLKRNFKHLESLVNQTYSPYRLKDPNVNRFKLESYRFLDFITQYKGVDHFHSNGNTVAKHYQEKLHVNPSRITNIPRGREPNPFLEESNTLNSIREELDLKNNVILVNVARHEYQKAQTVIIDALNELKPLKLRYTLLLVGRNGEATGLIKDKIDNYGLQESIKMLGHRSDVAKILAASDIFVFPSRFEGLPGALIEAEAAGLPILCSDIPNNREVVQENINSFIFPVDDSIILSQHIERLISDESQRKRMGNKSLEIYKKKFTIEQVHIKMKEMLDNVTNK